MTAMEALPSDLRKIVTSFPADAQKKVRDLHAKFNFDENSLDCFNANHGDLNPDLLPIFQSFLEKNAAKQEKPKVETATKRRRTSFGATMSLPTAVGAALGRREPEVSTPYPKRLRDVNGDLPLKDGQAARGTPDPLPKPLQVSLKSTLNESTAKPPQGSLSTPVNFEMLGDPMLWTGHRKGTYAWMDEAIEDRTAAQDLQLAAFEGRMGQAMLDRHSGEEGIAVGTVGVPTQAEVVLCGRILCEGLEGRLNEHSLLLEGSKASSNSSRVQLVVSECKQVAAFPGQIVSVLGRSNMSGNTFHARDFIPGLPMATVMPRATSPMHIMVAAGPFCLRDTLDYTPLEQVLQHANQEHPQVLVLFGPFLDANNQRVAAGDTKLPGEDEPCTYEEVYTHHLLPLLLQGLTPLRRAKPPTEVLIVPSLDEVLSSHPMPQPPLDAALGIKSQVLDTLRNLGVRFVPNPGHVRLGSIRLSLTSADALSPILRELVLRPEGKKIDEALRLLLRQQNLFPVLPRDPPQVSESRATAFNFPESQVPEICIFPSAFNATGNVVEDTLFVNPGTLCRPAAPGTFVELFVAPQVSGMTSKCVGDCTRIEIKKLG